VLLTRTMLSAIEDRLKEHNTVIPCESLESYRGLITSNGRLASLVPVHPKYTTMSTISRKSAPTTRTEERQGIDKVLYKRNVTE
jgi:hypothetical protein